MPIRARVLRRPLSNAARRWPAAPPTDSPSAPRDPASSAASSMARRGRSAVAPTARTIAAPWTSRTSAASHSTSVRPRRPARGGGGGGRGPDRGAGRDEQPAAAPGSRSGLRCQPVETALQPTGALPGVPRGVERADPTGERGDEAVEVRDVRTLQAKGPPATVTGQSAQPRRPIRRLLHWANPLQPRYWRVVTELGHGPDLAQVVGE